MVGFWPSADPSQPARMEKSIPIFFIFFETFPNALKITSAKFFVHFKGKFKADGLNSLKFLQLRDEILAFQGTLLNQFRLK